MGESIEQTKADLQAQIEEARAMFKLQATHAHDREMAKIPAQSKKDTSNALVLR